MPSANDYDLEMFGPTAAYIKGSYNDTGLVENIIHNAIVTGTYYVRVYGYPVGNGSYNDKVPYSLTAGFSSGPVSILTQPQSRSVPAGANASFSVTAAGAPPLTYQWQRDGMDIPGATLSTINWTGAGNIAASGMVVSNLAGGMFDIQTDANFKGFSGGTGMAAFYNLGTLRKSGGTGTNLFDGGWNLNNSGLVDVQTGTLLSGGWGTNSGIFNAAGNAAILFGGGITSYTNAAFTGSGASRIFGGVRMSGIIAGQSLELTSAGNIAGTFTNVGTMTWTGGYLYGQMTVAAGGVLILSGDGDKILYGYDTTVRLDNAGTMNWTGGKILGRGAVINNQAGGMFNIACDGLMTYFSSGSYTPPTFNNLGVVRKATSQGMSILDANWHFNNSGTLDVQNGTVVLAGGASLSSGTINIGIGSPSLFGRLVLNGTVALGGILSINLLNNYQPNPGDSFTVINYDSHTGYFVSTLAPAGWYQGGQLNNNYLLQPGQAYLFLNNGSTLKRWRQAVPYAP